MLCYTTVSPHRWSDPYVIHIRYVSNMLDGADGFQALTLQSLVVISLPKSQTSNILCAAVWPQQWCVFSLPTQIVSCIFRILRSW